MLKQAAAAAALVNNPLLVGNKPPATSTASGTGTPAEADLLGSILKSNPALMLNPAAMLGLNPSLYAVQLAQLQLLAQQGGAAAAAGASSLDALRRLSDTEAASNLRKRKHDDTDDPALAGLNLTAAKSASPAASPRLAESPLDLSGSKKLESNAKIPKLGAAGPAGEDNKMPLSWPPFMHPLIAAGALTPEAISRLQMGLPPASMAASATSAASSENENPLKRMNEIAKGTSAAAALAAQGPGSPGSKMVPGGARPSAWQSQWLNRGPESNKDIFKCVWCKESFASLQSLTTHMKETKHFGASIPASPQLPPSPATMSRPSLTSTPTAALRSPTPTASAASGAASKNRDILKEQLPMPRKLVRGQDVWLGRGEQQTRDILKCMWCGESFRSLDLMTKHMQETKHYTKVISQVICIPTSPYTLG